MRGNPGAEYSCGGGRITLSYSPAERAVARKQKNGEVSPPSALPGVNDATPDHTDPEHSLPFPIACIGASAGGIEATSQLLGALAPDTGIAYVLIQHLDPVHPSALNEIYARVTAMPVVIAEHGMTVEPDHVYLIPPGKSLALGDHRLQLMPRTELRGQHRPIDFFLRSLAEEQGYKSIGIVLSGMGNDGTLGLEEIKAAGGITFAQDDSADQTSMPRAAIAGGSVDLVLSPQEIANEINRISRHPFTRRLDLLPDLLPEHVFAQIIRLLRDASGVDFSSYKRNTLHRRITRRMVLHRFDRLEDYAAFLARTPREAEALYQDVLINVTSFFRDPDAYEVLTKQVFPELAQERTRHEPVRVWALGCSTGEEAYSIAMAYTEFAETQARRAPLQIFATDLNAAGIERARLGIYPKSIEQDVTPERLRRFFVEVDGQYRICKPIRDMCVFARQNVLSDPPFSRLDLVACRNVMIYLQPVLQQRLVPMLHYALRSRGMLWLGTSETIGSYGDLFEVCDARNKFYRRKDGPARLRVPAPALSARELAIPPVRVPSSRDGLPADTLREADRLLAMRFAPPGVVVNADLDIVQFRGDTTPFLVQAPGKASLNLVKMARDGLAAPLRRAIAKARREAVTVREDGLRARVGDTLRELSIEVVPMSGSERAGNLLVLFLAVADAAEAASPRGARATVSGLFGDEREAEIERLRQELAASKDYVQSLIEQYEATNEELQSSNEEVQSSNEELQSINEELETSKEEIQSSNEELSSVNEELHHRNLEISQTNNDLVNLLISVNVAIVILGTDLRIRRLTPAAEKVLNLIPTDVGRPISDIKLPIAIEDLEKMLLEVIESVTVQEREVRDGHGRWYLLRARAYKTIENRIEGAVLMLVDVDALKRTEQALSETESRFALMADSAPVQIWVAQADGRMFVNRAYREFIGSSETQLRPEQWLAHLHEDDRAAYQSLYEDSAARSAPFDALLRMRRVDGEYRWMKCVACPRLSDSGELFGYVGSCFDIQDMKEAEQALREADAAKNVFLAVMAHELRTPLAAVTNSAQVMGAVEPGSEPYVAARDILQRQVGNMTRLIDDLVDLSRMKHGLVRLQKERIDLVATVRAALQVQQPRLRERGIVLQAEFAAQPIWVDADPMRLEQIFANLLGNAIKHTPRDGRIQLVVATDQPATGRGAQVATVRITDSGRGIASDMLDRIFLPFAQVEPEGPAARHSMGLGLALSRQLVELHGGSITAHSAGAGAGSEFTVRLPVLGGAVPSYGAPPTVQGARSVLIVEDNDDTARALELMLRYAGFKVEVAASGTAALAAARRHTPDAILLDIDLPDIGGWSVARTLRQDPGFASTLLVALTGLGDETARQESRDAGIDHHLVKPVDVHALIRLVEQHAAAAEAIPPG
jgi:two-component system, chemotaxis family, CheB/CheR fusion protein